MRRCGRRAWAGLRLTVSLFAGATVAAVGSAADAASPKGNRDGKVDAIVVERPGGTPVVAVVALNQQRVTVYDADGPMLQAPVSTGQTGYETPAGIYTVLEKKAEHYSNLYDDASMPFMQRLTWSGIALHAGVLPGYPASHGCVRMPLGFAERLFERTKLGMRVIVVRDDMSPADFVHSALFKPLPAGAVPPPPALGQAPALGGVGVVSARVADAVPSTPPTGPRLSLRAVAAAKAAAATDAAQKADEAQRAARRATAEAVKATKSLRRAEALKARAVLQLRQAERLAPADSSAAASQRVQYAKSTAQAALATAEAELILIQKEMQPMVDSAAQLREQARAAEAASVAALEESKEAARKLLPVSVFISRATQRLYVRQAREPLLDAPVTIADPDAPLGTYVYTALAYTNGESDLRWNVVSMYGRHADAGKRRDGTRHATATSSDLAGAKVALDRISIPQDAIDRISEVVGPGSSLIVSDETLSRETGKATEFIVVMSAEPQGGIRIRRRNPNPEARFRYQRPYNGSPFGWSSQPFWWW